MHKKEYYVNAFFNEKCICKLKNGKTIALPIYEAENCILFHNNNIGIVHSDNKLINQELKELKTLSNE